MVRRKVGAERLDLKGALCVVLGAIAGGSLTARAWLAWRDTPHAVENAWTLGLVAFGVVMAAVDASWRLHAPSARSSRHWTDLAFDAGAGARIQGWPVWIIGAAVASLAALVLPSA